MKVVLHELSKCNDGAIQLQVSFGGESPRVFLAKYDGADPKYKFCSVDEELFMRLSDLAHKRFGNCAVYQMELMGIISDFDKTGRVQNLPATLGTTPFCTMKPGMLKILRNKFWILMDRVGLHRPRIRIG